jgi:hypothetical protein
MPKDLNALPHFTNGDHPQVHWNVAALGVSAKNWRTTALAFFS